MSEDEYAGDSSVVGANGANGTGGDRDKRAPRFSWTPAYEATFFRSLCESVQLGLRENHSFKSEAWDRAAAALRDKHNAYPAKSHLVNKSDNARKKFRLWRGLREDPEFLYNPTTRTVTASEEAWKAHITKEPLSRALRGRPFEHEDYMEILYPDVVGSGGAPKRIMKTRRKGPDTIPGGDDGDMPGTAVLDLQVDAPYVAPPPPQHQQQQPSMGLPAHAQPALTQPVQVGRGVVTSGTAVPHPRPTSTAIPPRTTITSTSALTPPEETMHTRKRFLVGHPPTSAPVAGGGDGKASAGGGADKRRRISATAGNNGVGAGGGRTAAGGGSSTSSSGMVEITMPGGQSAGLTTQAGRQVLLEEGILALADALRTRSPPRWPEQAMDIFYRDFGDEDMDLQLKIAEKVLADENKAMVFCKMPAALRGHWVKRLREMHNRSA